MSGSDHTVTRFLNADLDLRGDARDIGDFLRPLDASVIVLRHDGQDASIELADEFASLEATLSALIEWVRALQPAPRLLWDRLHVRTLNVGIQAAGEPRMAAFAISASTIEMIAAFQFKIVFTVYASAAS